MKTCNGCKYAEWKLTGIGHLHPSGGVLNKDALWMLEAAKGLVMGDAE
jgi:hypothetical protein